MEVEIKYKKYKNTDAGIGGATERPYCAKSGSADALGPKTLIQPGSPAEHLFADCPYGHAK